MDQVTNRPLSPFLLRLIDAVAGDDPAAREQLTEDMRRAVRRIEVQAILRRSYPSADDAEIKRLTDQRLGDEP